MIIHFKQKKTKEQGHIFYTGVDDYLFSKILENTSAILNGQPVKKTMAEISFDLDGRNINLFSPASVKQADPPLWPLFCLQDINWNSDQHLEMIASLFYSKSTVMDTPHPPNSDNNRKHSENRSHRPDYMAKLAIGREALSNEYHARIRELNEYENILEEIKTLHGLKNNLNKLKQDVLLNKDQIKKNEENLILAKEKIALYSDCETKLEKNRTEVQELQKKLSSISSREEMAKEQMVNLDIDLESTNEQGLQYIQKLESIEKNIFSLDQNLSLSEETVVPKHVRSRVDELGNIINIYMKSLEKLAFLAHQISDLEIAVSDMRGVQQTLMENTDLSEEISTQEDNLKELNSELARINGQEESFYEGKKLLSDGVCPIISKTCTTIEEPVEDFFDKKISALAVERGNIHAKIESLEKTMNDLKLRQEKYREWQTYQAKIYQSLDFIRDAIIDFQKEEDHFLSIPIGDKALAIIELLSGIVPDEQRTSLQKRFIELGTSNDESDLVRRITLYSDRASRFKDSWEKAYADFNTICDKKEEGISQIKDKKSGLLQEKEQLRKEYGLICRQVESIEKQRKELSKVLFEAGKTKQFKEHMDTLINQGKKLEEDVDNFKTLKSRIARLTNKIEFLKESHIGLKETEDKYTGEYKILNHQLHKVDSDEVNTKIFKLRETTRSLENELDRVDHKIEKIKNENLKIESKEKNVDLFSDQFIKKEQLVTEKYDPEFRRRIQMLKKRIKTICDLQNQEYNRRFEGKLPKSEQTAINLIIKTQELLQESLWKKYLPMAVVFNPEELFWWKERIDRNQNLMLIGPKKFENMAAAFEDSGLIN